MGHTRVLAEFWRFLREEKKYWLVPIASCSCCSPS